MSRSKLGPIGWGVELRVRSGVPGEKSPSAPLSSLILHVFHQIMKFSLILLITVGIAAHVEGHGCGCNGQDLACAPTCPCQTATGFCQDWDDVDAKTCDKQQVCTVGREKRTVVLSFVCI